VIDFHHPSKALDFRFQDHRQERHSSLPPIRFDLKIRAREKHLRLVVLSGVGGVPRTIVVAMPLMGVMVTMLRVVVESHMSSTEGEIQEQRRQQHQCSTGVLLGKAVTHLGLRGLWACPEILSKGSQVDKPTPGWCRTWRRTGLGGHGREGRIPGIPAGPSRRSRSSRPSRCLSAPR
jgi:hypothetical protein